LQRPEYGPIGREDTLKKLNLENVKRWLELFANDPTPPSFFAYSLPDIDWFLKYKMAAKDNGKRGPRATTPEQHYNICINF
jgi:hypothetical protein